MSVLTGVIAIQFNKIPKALLTIQTQHTSRYLCFEANPLLLVTANDHVDCTADVDLLNRDFLAVRPVPGAVKLLLESLLVMVSACRCSISPFA